MKLQLRLPKKQIGVAAIASLAVLFPQILPLLLGLVLLAQGGEAFFSKGFQGVLDLGAWSRLYPAWALFLFPLVAFALLPWAEWPGRSALRAFRLSGEILMALGLAGILLRLPSELAVQRARAVTLGLCIGAGLAIADRLSHGGGTGFLRGRPVEAITYGRSAILVALMTVPTLLAAPFSRFHRLLLIIPGLILVAISVNLAAKLLLPIAILGALLGRWPRGGFLLVLLVSSPLLLPWILPFALSAEQECTLWLEKASAMHRLQIWAYASDLIRQRPWGGWGLDAARYLGAAAPEIRLPECAHGSLGRDRVPLLPLHPHNGILQLWAELGIVGASLLPGMILIILQKIKNYPRIPYITTLAALAGATIPILISFGFWQGWWISGLTFFWGVLLLYFSPHP